MNEFLQMGGYAEYIWPCYGAALVVLVSLLLISLKDLKKSKKDLAIMEQISIEEES